MTGWRSPWGWNSRRVVGKHFSLVFEPKNITPGDKRSPLPISIEPDNSYPFRDTIEESKVDSLLLPQPLLASKQVLQGRVGGFAPLGAAKVRRTGLLPFPVAHEQQRSPLQGVAMRGNPRRSTHSAIIAQGNGFPSPCTRQSVRFPQALRRLASVGIEAAALALGAHADGVGVEARAALLLGEGAGDILGGLTAIEGDPLLGGGLDDDAEG